MWGMLSTYFVAEVYDLSYGAIHTMFEGRLSLFEVDLTKEVLGGDSGARSNVQHLGISSGCIVPLRPSAQEC